MFVKVTRSKNFKYLQLVESYREDGKSKHKVIANIGRFDELKDNPVLKALGKRFLQIAGCKEVTNELKDMREIERLNYGYIIYRKLMKQLKIDQILEKVVEGRKIKYDFGLSVLLMVLDRLMAPVSKLGSYERQERYCQLPHIELNHLYRSLDILSEGKEYIETELFKQRKSLFNQSIDVVFYDVTTFFFESVKADGFKEFGYSKDSKFKEVQVVLGLLVDVNGVPIGYELFPGNTFEGKTLEQSLLKLKNRFKIKEVIIVSDRAMGNKENLLSILENGYDYIIGMKARSQKESIKEEILDLPGYKVDKGLGLSYKVIEGYERWVQTTQGRKVLKENLLCTWSEKRAEKDQKDRMRLIEKAKKMISNKDPIIDKRGAKKYIKTKGKLSAGKGLNLEKIKEDSGWDGFYVIETNKKDLTHEQILAAYHNLWKIEESFRIMKTTMEARPIFHWTEKRIKGHFVLCFLSFLLQRKLELKLKDHGIEESPEKIKEAINSLELSLIEVDYERYYLKGKSKPLGKKILNEMRIKHLKNLNSAEEFVLPA